MDRETSNKIKSILKEFARHYSDSLNQADYNLINEYYEQIRSTMNSYINDLEDANYREGYNDGYREDEYIGHRVGYHKGYGDGYHDVLSSKNTSWD